MRQVVAPVTEAEVEAAVQALIAAGAHPSVRRVRDAVGRGSMTTINSMLGKVRTTMDIPALPTVALARPAQVVVMPAPANQAMGPSTREIELERELAEERGRVSELRRQLEAQKAEQVEAVADAVADAVSKMMAKQVVKLPAALDHAVEKLEKLIKQAGVATEQLAVAGSAAADMTGEAVGQTKMLLREAPGYHRDLLHALRAVEIAGEWLRQQFQPQAEPLKLVADIDGAPPVLTAAATARAKPRAKAAPRTRKG